MCALDGCGSHAQLPPLLIRDEDRRRFLRGLATLPLAAVLSDAALAATAAGRLDTVTITPPGGQAVNAALAVPAKTPAPAVLLIHEWWGLNDQIKSVAAELAQEGYLALAVDLYDGKVATTPEEAKALMTSIDAARATETLKAWIAWLRDEPRATGKVATMGWCFGGGWSLNASLAAPVDATIIYYGNVAKSAADLAQLKGPVLGHFGTKDQGINQAMVKSFEKAMAEAGKKDSLTVYWYDADHAFANPTGARYDAEDAALAWQRSKDFLKQTIG
jgi:carboxymethylenebutenolidase